jgi:hypothetical protein
MLLLIETLILLPCFSRNFDIWFILMTVIITSLYLLSNCIIWMGKKIQVNKRIRLFHVSHTRIRISRQFTDLQSKLESFLYCTLTRENNDSSSPTQYYKSSCRTYTHKHTVIQKNHSILYLLIAWTLLEKSPMYSPSNSNFHVHTPPAPFHYINMDNFLDIDPDPPPSSTPSPSSPLLPTALQAKGKDIKTFTFDTDSFKIGIDTHATACMSPELSDFDQSTLVPFPASNGGIRQYGKGPLLKIESTGTLQWILEDDNGIKHTVRIPNSIYCPQGT